MRFFSFNPAFKREIHTKAVFALRPMRNFGKPTNEPPKTQNLSKNQKICQNHHKSTKLMLPVFVKKNSHLPRRITHAFKTFAFRFSIFS